MLKQMDPREAGHHQIQQDNGERSVLHLVSGFVAIGALEKVRYPAQNKGYSNRFADLCFIVNDKDRMPGKQSGAWADI